MTLLKKFIAFIAIVTVLFSCQKEMSVEDVKSPVLIDASWQFSESGKTFMGEIDTAFIIETSGGNILSMIGTTADGITGQIILEVAGNTVTAGTYTGDYVSFIYGEGTGVIYNSVPGSTGFSVTITAIDSASVTGTFSGTVKGADGSDKTIVDGKFTAAIGTEDLIVIPPDPNNSDYFTLGSVWTYANENDPSDMVTISAIKDTMIPVEGTPYSYTVFENSKTGEHKYYRKNGNDFHEFTSTRLGQDADPTEIDLIILKQDAEVGEPWETAPYQFTIGGGAPAINAKIVNTILAEKDISTSLGGYKYENIIEVTTELYVEIGDEFSPSNTGTYYTAFSKGIGIIRYYDFDSEAYYLLKSYTP